MFCLEGAGAISQVSLRHKMEFFKEPMTFAAISVKDCANGTKVLEGPVRRSKYYGGAFSARGNKGKHYGLPRFTNVSCKVRFPFTEIELQDSDIPLEVQITGWSPFIPGNSHDSCLPAGALEYSFTNPGPKPVEAVFSFHSANMMSVYPRRLRGHGVKPVENGFILYQSALPEQPHQRGSMAIAAESPDGAPIVDHCWFRGEHYDSVTILWQTIASGKTLSNPPQDGACPGASLYCPLKLKPGEKKTVRVRLCWHVPGSDLSYGKSPSSGDTAGTSQVPGNSAFYEPWYATQFKDIEELSLYWSRHYNDLRKQTDAFHKCLYGSSFPSEVKEAIGANLHILKAPTILRQKDGRLWGFEGCNDEGGCCHGSCTHVWNYAQALPHLFPDLERSLRQTEFNESQNETGRQSFRSNLPIRPVSSDPKDFLRGRYAAADGQLGGLMKTYRDWRICADLDWLKSLWPKLRQSLEYCISTWDPRRTGLLEEPQHNTFDIQFWGPNGMCSSFYLGALKAATEMGNALGQDVAGYKQLYATGKKRIEAELFNGEYFYQTVRTKGLNAPFQLVTADNKGTGYADVVRFINESGPKYQYGNGCLSDGLTGAWLAKVCGLGDIIDPEKVKRHLSSVYKYNLKKDLTDHVNPQRPSYAFGPEGGLLMCTWPKGDPIPIPFIYSNEVWTGIEYMVASHMMMMGMVDEGCDIVRTCRKRYDGQVRNPFDEYECGHYYVRALSSYALIQGLTGIRFDAVDKTLNIDPRIGRSFKSFIATATGFGTVGLKNGKPFLELVSGQLDVRRTLVSGAEMKLNS